MKQTILNEPPEKTKRRCCLTIVCCCLFAALTLGINLLLAFCFTDETYRGFLTLNILSDVIVGCLIVFLLTRIKKQRLLLRLSEQKGTVLDCTVSALSADRIRYLDMDCCEVTASGRNLFLPCDTITLRVGGSYRLHTVSNVITEAEG